MGHPSGSDGVSEQLSVRHRRCQRSHLTSPQVSDALVSPRLRMLAEAVLRWMSHELVTAEVALQEILLGETSGYPSQNNHPHKEPKKL